MQVLRSGTNITDRENGTIVRLGDMESSSEELRLPTQIHKTTEFVVSRESTGATSLEDEVDKQGGKVEYNVPYN
jgi:hypothetical protein